MTARRRPPLRAGRTLAICGLAALATFGTVATGPAAFAGGPVAAVPAAHSAAAAGQESAGRLELLAEARRELTEMKRTRYQHKTEVNPEKGEYFYDCSGFVDYALTRSVPAAFEALPHDNSKARPLAEDYVHHLHRVAAGKNGGPWQTVRTPDLLPGDVIAWLATEDSTTNDTGHVVIVLEPPARNPARSNEWLVKVADSTRSPHADDSRAGGGDGLGTGIIGLDVDSSGHPVGYFWRGGVSKKAKQTEVVFGRPG
jgi:hypothetical protein